MIPATDCPGDDAHVLAMQGGQLTPEEKTSLEEKVSQNPSDIESRTKLLGYYFRRGLRDSEAKMAKQQHIVWLIENAPEAEVLGIPFGQLNHIVDPVGYDRAKRAWAEVIQRTPDNLPVLRNASRFFLLSDRGFSEELLLRGQKLDTKNPQWSASLGQLYSLGMTSLPGGPPQKEAAEKAFRQYRLAYELSDAMGKDRYLSDMAKTAFTAGLTEEARKLATQMLEENGAEWNQDNRVHQGNLLLGRIALSEGNVDEAKSRLLQAGKIDGSPQLSSFGPNMLLAKELLERGEREVVLEYFELCRKFWTSPRRELDTWTADVKSQRIPDFGPNLAY